MNTPARPPVREARLLRQAAARAFTLIELLTVIAIIAILSAISFGVIKGVKERSSIGQAKAEVAVIAQALETYKMQYGDYPQATSTADPKITPNANAVYMLQALIGKKGPTGVAMTQKALLDISKFSLSDTTGDPFSSPGSSTITLVDPWGNSYMYYYYTVSTGSNITKRSFLLFSQGPDGYSTVPSSMTGTTGGTIDNTDVKNSDNIYAN